MEAMEPTECWKERLEKFDRGSREPEAARNIVGEFYSDAGRDLGKMVGEKQLAYGNSYGKAGQVMRILYPDGIRPEQMDDALAVVRVIDKLFRIATNKTAYGENPWLDIAGYGLLGSTK